MYNFDPYNVLLAIATNILYLCYLWLFCAPGSHIVNTTRLEIILKYTLLEQIGLDTLSSP